MSPNIHNHSPADAKIALFRSLFRGREDVYPRRFESRKTGRSGYSPACANEWVRGVCEKPRIKCADCANRQFLPVTDETARWHLTGLDGSGKAFVMGVYPMLLDESCHFLAVDFDGEAWQEDALAYLETCESNGIHAALERSRSGNGGHVWIFFDEAAPAGLARKLGASILTETMERRPDLGFASYDRFFPNQDTIPRGGFGNLIALPLQHEPRQAGNSVFVDADLKPFPDQWAYLSGLEKLSRARVETLAQAAEKKGSVLGIRAVVEDEFSEAPWTAPPSRKTTKLPASVALPAKLELVLGDRIYISKAGLPPILRNRLMRLAAFQNPEFYRAQAMRLPTYDKPRIICCAEDESRFLALPRGCLEETLGFLENLGIAVEIVDERHLGHPLELTFQGKLREEQLAAAEALLARDDGVLSATTAFGKTVVAAWLIAKRRTNTLVLVHRQQLMEQWVERLSGFLAVSGKDIGRLGGGRKKLTGNLDIALIQSLVRKGEVDDRIAEYGHVIVDECHHISARSFELCLSRAKAKFVTGLSATVTRKDGHHPIVFMQCGPVRYRVDAKAHAAKRPFAQHVNVRPTAFRDFGSPEEDPRAEFQRLYAALIADEARNAQIVEDIVRVLEEGRSPLVLTERTEHLENLTNKLSTAEVRTIALRGGLGKKTLDAALTEISKEEGSRVVLATGRFVGEGFDDSRLDTLFLTLPVSWRGTIAQYAGRLHRLHEGKREVRIYDYADLEIPMLSRMFDKRCRGYEDVGYTVLVPGNALPGWPAEVLLPADPGWKDAYDSSVRRLIRDGVDLTLADLFRQTAKRFPNDAKGAKRARSSSEAFFYRRLQTLPEMRGQFELNGELPIPWNESGHMEVDFLCREARLAVEIDGQQHLNDREAYRRDRRKDALLQGHGYIVLRFLAEDLGTRLGEVLDTIARVLSARLR